MNKTNEQRREMRLRYPWFIQFAKNVKEVLSQGRIVDVSSKGVAFVCYANKSCPSVGELVTTRFSIPQFDSDKSFDTVSFNRIGRVCRIQNQNDYLRCVAIQFAKPLPFKPGEQPISKYDRIFKLATNSDGVTAALNLKIDPKNHYETTSDKVFVER